MDEREKTQQFIRQTFIEPCSVHWARTLQNTKMHQQGLSVMWVYIMYYRAGITEWYLTEVAYVRDCQES